MSEEAGILKRDSPTVYFGTTNTHKFGEAKSILGTLNIKLKRLNEKGIEIQAEQLEAIADYAVKSLAQRSSSPVIVEDAGLFIDSLSVASLTDAVPMPVRLSRTFVDALSEPLAA